MTTTTTDPTTGVIDRLVRGILLPVTGAIPALVTSGALLVLFAALWLAFGVALVANPSALDEAWRSLAQLPLPIQGIAWLLLMPVLAGLWVWGTAWPLVVRLVLIAGIAGWNLIVFVPRRAPASEVVAQS